MNIDKHAVRHRRQIWGNLLDWKPPPGGDEERLDTLACYRRHRPWN